MKKFTAFLLTIFLILGNTNSVLARTPAEILADVNYLYDQMAILEAVGQFSNTDVSAVVVDLSKLNSLSVSEHVYQQISITPAASATFGTPGLFTIDQAEQKLIQYVLGNVANVYRAEPLNTEVSGKIYRTQESIAFYVYGQHSVQLITEIYQGIPNCFPIEYDRSGGYSDPIEPIPMPVTEKTLEEIGTPVAQSLLATFTIGNTALTTATISSSSPDVAENPTTKTMDVAPYIKDSRTYVPVAHLAFSLGVPTDGVTWNGATRQVGIKKDDTDITLLIGSPIMFVNQNPVRMDVSPEITKDRTFLPAGWVAEALGADVSWSAQTNQIVIKTPIEAPGS